VKTTRLDEKLAKLKEEMGKLAAYEKRMLASPDHQVSLTDPDSRSMATSGRGSGIVGYNAGCRQHRAPSDHHARGDEQRLGSGPTRQCCQPGEGCSADRYARRRCRPRLLQQPADSCVSRGRHHRDAAKAEDVEREIGGPFWQAVLRLHRRGRRLSLSGRRAADLSLQQRGGWQGPAALLDHGVLQVPAQIAMHDGTGAAHRTVGARASARRRTALERQKLQKAFNQHLFGLNGPQHRAQTGFR
jgi:hypothetical protein